MTKVESLPNSPTTCRGCGKPVAIKSIDPTGWITMVPHECIKPYPWPMCPRCGCEKNACICSSEPQSETQKSAWPNVMREIRGR